jgi:hypothetical protein
MDETQEIIKEQLNTLPKVIKDAISSIDLGGKIRRIADKNMLHIDQAGVLENETMFVMIGLEPIEDYKENIKRELNISRDRAQAITAEIDKEIFMSIREAMKKVQNNTTDESEEIKKQVEKQNLVRHTAPPPPNLPTAEPVAPAQSQDIDSNLVARHLSDEQDKPHFEKKKPYSTDPYREPVE